MHALWEQSMILFEADGIRQEKMTNQKKKKEEGKIHPSSLFFFSSSIFVFRRCLYFGYAYFCIWDACVTMVLAIQHAERLLADEKKN